MLPRRSCCAPYSSTVSILRRRLPSGCVPSSSRVLDERDTSGGQDGDLAVQLRLERREPFLPPFTLELDDVRIRACITTKPELFEKDPGKPRAVCRRGLIERP